MNESLPRMAAAPTQAEAKEQFSDLVKLQMSGNKFMSDEKERALLQEGLRCGMRLDQARGMVRGAAEERNCTLQRDVDEAATFMLKTFADPRNRVKRADFERVVGFYAMRAEGAMSAAEVSSRVKEIMEQNQLTPRRAGLMRTKRWYNRIK